MGIMNILVFFTSFLIFSPFVLERNKVLIKLIWELNKLYNDNCIEFKSNFTSGYIKIPIKMNNDRKLTKYDNREWINIETIEVIKTPKNTRIVLKDWSLYCFDLIKKISRNISAMNKFIPKAFLWNNNVSVKEHKKVIMIFMIIQIVIREQQFVRKVMIFDNLVRYAIRNVHRLTNIGIN